MKLYAIRYGKNFKYGTKGSVLKGTESENDVIPEFPFYYYLAELDGEWLLIDTGFRDETLAANMGVTLLPVEQEVHKLCGDNKVTTVLLTHNHWDHVNNLDLYPQVDIFISREASEEIMKDGLSAVKECLQKEHTITFETECDVLGVFHMQVVGGHMPGSCIILFEEEGQKYIITGDECYVKENLLQDTPIGITYDAQKNKEFIHSYHDCGRVILPFHDKSIFQTYPVISENIVQII